MKASIIASGSTFHQKKWPPTLTIVIRVGCETEAGPAGRATSCCRPSRPGPHAWRWFRRLACLTDSAHAPACGPTPRPLASGAAEAAGAALETTRGTQGGAGHGPTRRAPRLLLWRRRPDSNRLDGAYGLPEPVGALWTSLSLSLPLSPSLSLSLSPSLSLSLSLSLSPSLAHRPTG